MSKYKFLYRKKWPTLLHTKYVCIFHTSTIIQDVLNSLFSSVKKSLMFFLKWKPKYSIIYKTYLRLPPLCLKLDIALSALWMDFCTLFNFNEPVPMPPGPRRLNDQFFFSPWYSAINWKKVRKYLKVNIFRRDDFCGGVKKNFKNR